MMMMTMELLLLLLLPSFVVAFHSTASPTATVNLTGFSQRRGREEGDKRAQCHLSAPKGLLPGSGSKRKSVVAMCFTFIVKTKETRGCGRRRAKKEQGFHVPVHLSKFEPKWPDGSKVVAF